MATNAHFSRSLGLNNGLDYNHLSIHMEDLLMTESLQNAFSLASRLPDTEQDEIAAWLMAELESESKWNALFRDSQDALAELAQHALTEHSNDETKDGKQN